MGGFFGAACNHDAVEDVFFGTDYHSHLGTRRGGMAAFDPARGLQRNIHNIENSPFRTKFSNVFEEMTGTSAIGCISAGVSNDTPDTVALRELRTGGRPLKDTEEDVPASIARAAALGKDAPRIYHTIGQEDFLLSGARETRDLLHSYPGDPFHYIYEEKPGKHGWEFCDGALRDFLQWLSPAPR